MRTMLFANLTTLTALAILPAETRALVAFRPAGIPDRVIHSACIATGEVMALEEKLVRVKAFPTAPNPTDYRIAVIKVEESLLGAKGITHVRVGFPPAQAGAPVPPRSGFPSVTLAVGQEGCFFLKPHPVGDFYTIEPMSPPLDPKGASYAKELEVVKTCVGVIKEPVQALKAKGDADRLFAASLLVNRYRGDANLAGGRKEEPIDAKQSRLILQILADADWSKADPRAGWMPVSLMSQLNLTDRDGWTKPAVKPGEDSIRALHAAFQKWVADHPEYRVRRYVAPDVKPAKP